MGGARRSYACPGKLLPIPRTPRPDTFSTSGETINPGLWAVRFSLESNEVEGVPFLVMSNASMPTVANDGTLLFVRRDQEPAELVKVGRDGLIHRLAELSASVPIGYQGWLDLSPDGRRVALPLDARPYGDLWVVDLDGGTQARLDSGVGRCGASGLDARQLATHLRVTA